MQSLVIPAAHLDPFPSSTSHPALSTLISDKETNEIHLSSLHALDLKSEALELAIRITKPREGLGPYEMERWEALEVNLWLGSLGVYNYRFKGLDLAFATEVIEHLPPVRLPSPPPPLPS